MSRHVIALLLLLLGTLITTICSTEEYSENGESNLNWSAVTDDDDEMVPEPESARLTGSKGRERPPLPATAVQPPARPLHEEGQQDQGQPSPVRSNSDQSQEGPNWFLRAVAWFCAAVALIVLLGVFDWFWPSLRSQCQRNANQSSSDTSQQVTSHSDTTLSV